MSSLINIADSTEVPHLALWPKKRNKWREREKYKSKKKGWEKREECEYKEREERQRSMERGGQED